MNASNGPQIEAYLDIDTAGRFAINGTATVGRAPGCEIFLNARSVSRQHAQIFLEGSCIRIKDLGSANGTYVNDNKVTTQELADGDVVCFGEVRSVFHVSAMSVGSGGCAPAAIEEDLNRRLQELESENIRLKKLVTQLERALADSNLRIRNLQERLK